MKWTTVKNTIGKFATSFVPSQGIVGLGSGTTSEAFIRALSDRYHQEKIPITCVVSSKETEKLALSLQLPVIHSSKWNGDIDVSLDGADAIDSFGTAIKGNGGALLREKIIAFASKRVIFMVDERKWNKPWPFCTLPVCVVPFGLSATMKHIQKNGFSGKLRLHEQAPFVTDDGLWIVDLDLNPSIPSLSGIDAVLKEIPGVVETGIFYQCATDVIVGYSDGKVNYHKVE